MSDTYENYGDANFFQGGLFIKNCWDDTYDVITCDFINDADGDKCYLVQDGSVDISDDWIDVDAVLDCAGVDEAEGAEFVAEAVRYYGLIQFGSTREYRMSPEEVIEFMNDYSAEYEFDTNTWGEGPLDW